MSGAGPYGDHIAMGDLADRVGTELANLADLTLGLQDQVGRAGFAGPLDPATVRGLQALDRIAQMLDELARLMDRVAAALPPDVTLPRPPILASLRLLDLVRAFDPELPQNGSSMMSAEAEGEVIWF